MYEFSLIAHDGETTTRMDVDPAYGEDVKLSVTRSPKEKYCRYDLEGTFTFTREDYDAIVNSTHDYFTLEVVWTEGGQSTTVISAPFSVMDLDIDMDNKIAVLKANGKDQYEEFLKSIDAEYDLVKLAPWREKIYINKRAFLQIYILGDKKLTNVVGNMEYEVDARSGAESRPAREIVGMGFKRLKGYVSLDIRTDQGAGLQKYDGRYIGDPVNNVLYREDGKFKAEYGTIFKREWSIVPASGVPVPGEGTLHFVIRDGTWVDVPLWYTTIQTEQMKGSVKGPQRLIYGRMIHDVDGLGTPFAQDDVWDKNLNYHYYKVLEDESVNILSNRVIVSEERTRTPNQWQQDDEGLYFVQPTPVSPVDRVIAIGWSMWIPVSIWLENGVDITESLKPYDETWLLRDAYRVISSIRKILGKIRPGMDVKSDFLVGIFDEYGDLINPVTMRSYEDFFITPITNVKKTYYSQAAQKGKVSLKQILDMLRKALGCYWFLENVDGVWRLRIEHEEWFRLGGHYAYEDPNPAQPIADLTASKVELSQKPWETDQRKFTYDISDVVSRTEFKWGDRAAEVFNGYPMVGTEFFAKKGAVDKVEVSNFTADIDIIQSSPESLSDDIFVVICAEGSDEPFAPHTITTALVGYKPDINNHPTFLVQNSDLCFYEAEQTFLNHDVSATKQGGVVMEGIAEDNLPLRTESYRRIIRQNITAPFTIKTPDLCYELIRSGLPVTAAGVGSINKISMNLFTQSADIELLFNDEHLKK